VWNFHANVRTKKTYENFECNANGGVLLAAITETREKAEKLSTEEMASITRHAYHTTPVRREKRSETIGHCTFFEIPKQTMGIFGQRITLGEKIKAIFL